MEMGMSSRQSMGQNMYMSLDWRTEVRPLCHIVHLLEEKGDFSMAQTSEAFSDYNRKHPSESLAERVYSLWNVETFISPENLRTFWNTFNQNILKVACYGLEEECSRGEYDPVLASTRVIKNLFLLYDHTCTLLDPNEASDLASKFYVQGLAAFLKNKDYIDKVLSEEWRLDSYSHFVSVI